MTSNPLKARDLVVRKADLKDAAFLDAGWLKVVEARGAAAVAQVYRALLAGSVRPDEGHILSLNPTPIQ